MLYFRQVMLGRSSTFRLLRGAAVVCVAFFLSFASVAPLAAALFSDSCCSGNHSHSCCRRKNAKLPVGPAFSSTRCCGCAQLALRVSARDAVVQSSARSPEALTSTFASVRCTTFNFRATFFDDARRQRPPPAFSLSDSIV